MEREKEWMGWGESEEGETERKRERKRKRQGKREWTKRPILRKVTQFSSHYLCKSVFIISSKRCTDIRIYLL